MRVKKKKNYQISYKFQENTESDPFDIEAADERIYRTHFFLEREKRKGITVNLRNLPKRDTQKIIIIEVNIGQLNA